MVYFFVFHFVWGYVGLWKDVGATTVNSLPISLHTNTHMYMGFPAKRDFKQRGAPHGMLYISSNTPTLKKADENSLFHKEDVHWKLPQGNDWHDDVQISNCKSRWTFWGQILPQLFRGCLVQVWYHWPRRHNIFSTAQNFTRERSVSRSVSVFAKERWFSQKLFMKYEKLWSCHVDFTTCLMLFSRWNPFP